MQLHRYESCRLLPVRDVTVAALFSTGPFELAPIQRPRVVALSSVPLRATCVSSATDTRFVRDGICYVINVKNAKAGSPRRDAYASITTSL
ncbi:hypothetical protein BN2476_470028 [Paraburkholderia piptadeniae]|uniref:Uncharacterized protein n=1 Tax=Paraburkholderia piptadeniae TaxID=1701573 RepID=A0A1N7SDV3_9BURK|nr:hypothetical protein BN2476_470028 [Paraburkholderia piptadeniae]